MAFQVLLTEDALQDLREIDTWITRHDGRTKADHVLARLEEALVSLRELPHRGHHPPELVSMGVREYREVFFKPYRIIYRARGKKVFVYLVADGRRDMQDLLAARLLRG